ncbi:alpha-L-rhamnosidase C-terminal domain-containing protein [Nonomuraea sp. NPDC005650]|uniref:alpha-L-rhamnosidase-related protein n=1 Tax=Nonomuraea sp. NPDC005650 TaxID=3157045 RepID=UPI0033B8B2E8
MDCSPDSPAWPSRWRGRWIWSERTAHGPATREFPLGALDPERFDRRVLFRRTFDLARVPGRAPFRVVSDSRHVLYVNGVELARGPVRHGPRMLHYDTGDAAPALREGHNVVAVLARFYGHRTPWWEPAPWTFTLGGGSLAAELHLEAPDEGWIVTDDGWRCQDATAWTPAGPRGLLISQVPELFDARALAPEWHLPDFDDSGWAQARELPATAVVGGGSDARPPSEPYGAMSPRPIPRLAGDVRAAETITVAPIPCERPEGAPADHPAGLVADLAAAGPATRIHGDLDLDGAARLVVADFGRIVSGHLRLTVEAGPGVVVDGALLEVVTAAAFDSANVFRYTTRGRDDVFELADPAGGRFAVLSLRGRGRVRLSRVELAERLRPRPAGPYFACSDPELEEIHRVGLRTVDLTAHDAYLDCPTREQRAWTGDSVVHQSVDLVANPDWSLARWHPRLAAQPRPDGMLPMVAAGDFAAPFVPAIPDWALHWIRSVHNLYRYTGDRELVAGLMPVAEGVLRWFLPFRGGDGLVHDVTGWVLIDWSPVQVRGTSAALNALWARGLSDFADIAEWLGDHGRARWARELVASVREAFEAFWDEARGAYRDHLVDGEVRPAVSEHTTAAAVCAGLVPEHRYARARALLLDRKAMFTRSPLADHGGDAKGPTAGGSVSARDEPDWDVHRLVVGAQPFFRYVVHDALALLGAADEIAGLCRDWSALLDGAPSAFRECWEGGSYCHGWSATPTRDLVVHTLGISPAEPGYARVRVAPRLGGLAWARGAVPSPYGLISVEVADGRVAVDSPVPVELSHLDGTVTHHPPGTTEALLGDPS